VAQKSRFSLASGMRRWPAASSTVIKRLRSQPAVRQALKRATDHGPALTVRGGRRRLATEFGVGPQRVPSHASKRPSANSGTVDRWGAPRRKRGLRRTGGNSSGTSHAGRSGGRNGAPRHKAVDAPADQLGAHSGAVVGPVSAAWRAASPTQPCTRPPRARRSPPLPPGPTSGTRGATAAFAR